MRKPSIWEKASFNVPDWYTEEQVMKVYPRCLKKAGAYYEAKGYTVLGVTPPILASETEHEIFTPPDARRYLIFLRVTKEPVTQHFDIPDAAVPEMEKGGLILAE
ncbi:hypothetical protein LCGC14_2201680 [marine sediment metagenome]|uniref:Uncharacterized protein n=1 Tax=marine sediment metagenome TaxID=412755 RepID=A0A0F9DGJ3_9ZZZZ